MGADQWVEKISKMGLTPSVADSHAYTPEMDVPCPELPGIKASFVLVGEGHRDLEAGVYLAVSILEIGVKGMRIIPVRDDLTS